MRATIAVVRHDGVCQIRVRRSAATEERSTKQMHSDDVNPDELESDSTEFKRSDGPVSLEPLDKKRLELVISCWVDFEGSLLPLL